MALHALAICRSCATTITKQRRLKFYAVAALVGLGLLWAIVPHRKPTFTTTADIGACAADAAQAILGSTNDGQLPLPEFELLSVKPVGHVACYQRGDTVCDAVRSIGMFEYDFIEIIAKAASTLRKEIQFASDILERRLQTHLPGGPKLRSSLLQAGDVIYMDIGGNVGSLAMVMWNLGFRTQIFEAFYQNAYLLSVAMCSNLETKRRTLPSDLHGSIPDLRLHHGALGPPGANGTCIMKSDAVNFGNIHLDCSPNLQQLRRGDLIPGTSSIVRGSVTLSTLDDILFGQSPFEFSNREAVKHFELLTRQCPQVLEPPQGRGDASPVVDKAGRVYEASSTQHLLEFVLRGQVIMKIDVESFEERVLRGGAQFLHDPHTRPRLIMSEWWTKTPMVAFFEHMLLHHGYVVFSFDRRAWIRTVKDAKVHQEHLRRITHTDQDTFFFVAPGYEYLLSA